MVKCSVLDVTTLLLCSPIMISMMVLTAHIYYVSFATARLKETDQRISSCLFPVQIVPICQISGEPILLMPSIFVDAQQKNRGFACQHLQRKAIVILSSITITISNPMTTIRNTLRYILYSQPIKTIHDELLHCQCEICCQQSRNGSAIY